MMNYLGYLRKRNPAGTPRRTLSHFLVCDSDKKKSVLANTFSDLFFAPPCRISSLARGNGKNCAASSRLFSFRLSDFPHARAWGSWDCAAPPALAPAASPHRRSLGEAAQSPRGSEARGLLFAAHPRFRYAPTHSRASVPAKKKSVPLRLARPWAGTLLSARDFSARARLRGRLFSCPT